MKKKDAIIAAVRKHGPRTSVEEIQETAFWMLFEAKIAFLRRQAGWTLDGKHGDWKQRHRKLVQTIALLAGGGWEDDDALVLSVTAECCIEYSYAVNVRQTFLKSKNIRIDHRTHRDVPGRNMIEPRFFRQSQAA